MSSKNNLVFLYDHAYPQLWRDGLWSALQILEESFNITYINLATTREGIVPECDFVLGWGGFGSKVDTFMRSLQGKKGLCIGGNAIGPHDIRDYDVLFYETEWYQPQIDSHPNIYHAFGINADIYIPQPHLKDAAYIDYLTVGAFSGWKRQERLLTKPGIKMAIGEIQKDNMEESISIIAQLLLGKVIISDMIQPEQLAKVYNLSKNVYIPADINGGGERAVLEARSCGLDVTVEDDNPKLQELLACPVYDQHYYAQQLKRGILSCL